MTTSDTNNADYAADSGTTQATAEAIAADARKGGSGGEISYKFALAAAEMAANTRCTNVVLLDLRGRSPVTDFFVIATGTSAVQMRAVANELEDLGAKMNYRKFHATGHEGAKWIVVDFVHVVAHVFDAAAREFYDLEVLWGDAPRIDWREILGLPPAPVEQSDFEDTEDEESDEGDADIDEDAETGAPVIVELPDLSTGSNSVSFVEVEASAEEREGDHAVLPTPVADEDEELLSAEDTDRSVAASESAERRPMTKGKKAVAKSTKGSKQAGKKGTGKKGVAKKALARKVAAKKAPASKTAAKKKPAAKKAPAKKAVKPAAKKAASKKAAGKAGKRPAKEVKKSAGKKSVKKPAKKSRR